VFISTNFGNFWRSHLMSTVKRTDLYLVRYWEGGPRRLVAKEADLFSKTLLLIWNNRISSAAIIWKYFSRYHKSTVAKNYRFANGMEVFFLLQRLSQSKSSWIGAKMWLLAYSYDNWRHNFSLSLFSATKK